MSLEATRSEIRKLSVIEASRRRRRARIRHLDEVTDAVEEFNLSRSEVMPPRLVAQLMDLGVVEPWALRGERLYDAVMRIVQAELGSPDEDEA